MLVDTKGREVVFKTFERAARGGALTLAPH